MSLLEFGVIEMARLDTDIELAHKERIDLIKRDWQISRTYPRKQKKAVRKKLMRSYSFLIAIKSYYDENLKIF